MKGPILATLFLVLFNASSHAQSTIGEESTMKSTKDIVLNFFSTFGTDKDWESMLATNMTFRSPMDETNSKTDFIPLDKQFRHLVVSASVNWITTEGGQASAIVDYLMALPSGQKLKIKFSEIVTVEAQKITSIEVFFDTAKFKTFLSQ